jgi:DNA repair protein RadC
MLLISEKNRKGNMKTEEKSKTEIKNKKTHAGHRFRMRDKFRKSGLDAFLNHEVLEFILTYAVPRKDTKQIAWNLIKRFGSIPAIFDAGREELEQIKGMGKEAALFISLIRALIRRYFFEELKNKNVIKCPQDVIKYCQASLGGEKDEVFEIIYLSSRNHVLNCERITIGTIDRASISPRKVVEHALKARATGMIFVHNHPSGEPKPSSEDIELTEELIKAASTLGLLVHDHIIIGNKNYYSFRANGLIKNKTV